MRSLLRAIALFTAVPVPAPATELTKAHAAAALRWLPLVGATLGAMAGLPLAAIRCWAPGAAGVGAVLAVTVLVVGTRGLHLDGLADTVDGLGSSAPADRALEIMRRGDVGPFGVAAVVLVLLLDVAALNALAGGNWQPVAALAVAGGTSRVAVVQAAHRRVPAARGGGFGALVAGSVSTPVAVLETGAVLGAAAGLAAAVGASMITWVVAPAVAMSITAGLRAMAVRRLGGVTGDVFGALVEVTFAVTLAGLAFG